MPKPNYLTRSWRGALLGLTIIGLLLTATMSRFWSEATAATLSKRPAVPAASAKPAGGHQVAAAQPATTQFTDINAGLTGVQAGSVAWGDYNKDGLLDILLTGLDSRGSPIANVYDANGQGGFTFNIDAGFNLPGVYQSSVAWRDYNNDGFLDILLTGQDSMFNPVSAVYNGGGGVFFPDAGASLPAVTYGSAAWGDYNNDGNLDILLTGYGNGSGPLARVYAGNGQGGFILDTAANLPGVYQSSVAWGDYNNDGFLDILLTGQDSGGSPIANVYTGDGQGGFTLDTAANLTAVSYGSVAWGDYNNDGNLDILLTGLTSGDNMVAKVYTGDGQGGFTLDNAANLTGVFYSSVAWGDYNNDGNLDILLTGMDSGNNVQALVYTGDGQGGFTLDNGAALPGVYLSSVAWGDYNNDGKLDILLTGSPTSPGIARVYRNDSNIPANLPPGAPAGLSASQLNPNTMLLSWLPASDDHTPAFGLNYNLRVGSSPGASDVVDPMAATASGYRRIASRGNAEAGITATISGLIPGHTYYWSVQAIDNSYQGGAFAAESSFVVAVIPTFTPTATATSTPTRTPTATTTSTPTSTPTASITPYPTYTAGPSSTPYPTYTQLPTSTPYPTYTAGPSSTPYPTNTPYPTYTAGPSSTPYPTNTAGPSSTPYPTYTQPPTSTATDTYTPAPTETPGGPSDTPTQPATVTPYPTYTPYPSYTPYPTYTLPPSNTPAPTETPGGPTDTPAPTNTLLPTNTPGGPTDTPAPPTPTACADPFVDLSGNVFRGAVDYLYCRGDVNGIDATHYSPAGTSTRGQFAKVVVLGFGLPFYTPPTPDFSDVPASYFAYLYIESGYHAAILSGFDASTCQQNGQPYPCYLPNRAITRGQLTKLVVSAGNYPLYTPTTPDFTDVPATNVFYASIETAFHNRVVGGYADHTFRPNNNIRRDEMAQIVFEGITHMP